MHHGQRVADTAQAWSLQLFWEALSAEPDLQLVAPPQTLPAQAASEPRKAPNVPNGAKTAGSLQTFLAEAWGTACAFCARRPVDARGPEVISVYLCKAASHVGHTQQASWNAQDLWLQFVHQLLQKAGKTLGSFVLRSCPGSGTLWRF